jgi:small-conductance mechanosensitive channel
MAELIWLSGGTCDFRPLDSAKTTRLERRGEAYWLKRGDKGKDVKNNTAKARIRIRGLVLPVLTNAVLGTASHFLFQSWIGWVGSTRAEYPAWIGNGIPFLQFMAVAFLVDRLFRTVAEELRVDGLAGQGMPKLALQLISVIIYFAFLGSSVGVVFGESVGGVLAASGIMGLAVGFAIRGLLADVFSGIALHLDASIHTGDWIDLSLRGTQISGRLVDIQWRTVVIADRSENHVFIPNSEFATATIVNRSQPRPATEYGASLPIGSQYDRARVVQVLENALARTVEAGVLLPQPAPYVRMGGLDASGALTYRLFYCLDLDRISPARAQHQTLSHAIDFLKAANIRLHPVHHGEYSRPAAPGDNRFTENDTRKSVLADVPLLAVLSQAELAALACDSAVRFLSGGQQVMRAGEDGTSMVVVVEGRLNVMVGGPSGNPAKVATLWPGECAGEMSLLTGSPRSADVFADGPTCLLEVPKAALNHLLQANPILVERIAAAIAKRKESGGPAYDANQPGTRDEDASTLIAKMRKFFRIGA